MSATRREKRLLMASIMLVAILARVLIPSGFMPASDRPFSLQVCWEGLPAALLASLDASHAESMDMGSMDMSSMDMGSMGGHHHPDGVSGSEHCVFGTACGAGPIPYLPLPSDFSTSRQLYSTTLALLAVAVRVVHLPQSRAPPHQLI